MATQIVEKAVKEDVTVAALAALASSDPAFAARVLAIVNSAAYGMGRTISDIGRACAMLGVRGLRNIALSLVLSDMVPTGQDGTVLLTISLRRAVAARLLARAVGNVPVDDAFTMGLFMELGLVCHARVDLAAAGQIARMPAAHRPVVERAFGMAEHARVGRTWDGRCTSPKPSSRRSCSTTIPTFPPNPWPESPGPPSESPAPGRGATSHACARMPSRRSSRSASAPSRRTRSCRSCQGS